MSKLNKRILSALLALVLFLTNFPVITLASDTFEITYEGKRVSYVEFYKHQKITVTAENIPEGSCQWQIKIPGTEQWVNIQGQTDAELGLSYAVVGSLLADDSAYVRCAVISGGTEVAHTAALRATVKEEEPVQQTPVVVPAATETPVESTEAPVEATEAPVEATEAPVEETETPVEETETPVEETETPVEETEAPVEVTEVPVEATEAPVEVTEVPVEATEAPIEATEASVEETEAPVEATEAPVEATEAPVEATEAPVEATEAPAAPAAEATEAPAEETEEATEVSAEETEEATEAPVEETEAPKKTSKKSSKKSSQKTTTQAVTDQKTESVTPKAAGSEDIEIVSVTINYVYWDRHNKKPGNTTWDPNVANIKKGDSYSSVVVNKVIPGYKTTFTIVDENGDVLKEGNQTDPDKKAQLVNGANPAEAYDPDVHTTSAVKIDLTGVSENIEYTVYYEEVEVPYTARYFMQNVYNDLYTEDTTILTDAIREKMKGYQGTQPDPEDIYPDVPGFTALFHQPDKIAADGSTVFEVYYDRNYYLINFDMAGGYGTAPVYARFETTFSVSNPTRAGYTFPAQDGWELTDWTKKTDTDEGTDEEKAAYNAALKKYIEDAETNTNGVIKKIPYTNVTYKAQWDKQQVNYTVAYWILDENGNKSFIGSALKRANSESVVDGKDNLGETDSEGNPVLDRAAICGYEEHTHIASCYCSEAEHTHDDECFTSKRSNDPGNGVNAIKAIGNGEPKSGYIYVIKIENSGNLWPKLYLNGSYYTVNGVGESTSATEEQVQSLVVGGSCGTVTGTYNGETLTATKYKAKADCGSVQHTHGDDCAGCSYVSHTHTSNCYCDTTYMTYVPQLEIQREGQDPLIITTDQDVTVKGDGSTVVNVYYQYKEYTLKFYYARTTGGTDSTDDDDTIPDSGFTKVEIPGGSTRFFGYRGGSDMPGGSYDTADDAILLQAVEAWGQITGTELPSLKSNQDAYKKSALEVGDYYYHYLTFTARFGDNISAKWPCDVFDSATRSDPDPNGYNNEWTSTTAVVSAWNPESRVKYVRDNQNSTIKGKYELLDENLLFDLSLYEDASEVSFLCFWENGRTNVNWNIPELYRYSIYQEALSGQDLTGKTVVTKVEADGTTRTYIRINQYDTCDDSWMDQQTQPSLKGFTPKYYNSSSKTYSGTAIDESKRVTVDHTNTGRTDENGNSVIFEWRELAKGTDYSGDVYNEGYEMYYYYTRNIHTLNFWNRNDWLNSGEGVVGGVAYGASLNKYFEGVTVGDKEYDGANDIVLEKYPSGLEPGAYKFEGWYTTAECLEGTKVDPGTMTMPDHDVTVYANWLPITHNTYFYLDYDAYRDRWLEDGKTLDSTKIYQSALGTPHGESMNTTGLELIPDNGTYRFVGWFYLDENGEKVAFNPSEMAVRKELHLYAEWTSTVSKQYTVQYFKGDEDGNIVDADGNAVAVDPNGRPVAGTKPVKLADDLTGYAFESTTKTFDAKPKDKLNLLSNLSADDQLALWLPHTNSHSIVVKGEESDNYFAFIYVRREKAPYWVRYVDAATGQEIRPTDHYPENKDAAVTVQFEYIHGYIPNSFYETLILSANDAENVITFYYTKDTTVEPGEGGSGSGTEDKNARYYVGHYIQTVDGKGFELYTSDEPVDEIGKEVFATPLTIAGFQYVDSFTIGDKTYTSKTTGEVKSGKDDANKALILELYYTRNKYGYKVNYLEKGTDKVLATAVTRDSVYYTDQTVEETALDITGYNLYGEETQTLKISANESLNEITFYYTPKPLTVNYVAVCPDSRGSDFALLSRYQETNTIAGSQAIPKSGFWFVGWYKDEECTELIQTEDRLTPSVSTAGGIYDYTFYALFKPIKLTITQTGMRNGKNESGVYEVVNAGGNVVATVIITGNNSVTIEQIPAGTYTVRELNGDWTWTYDHDGDNPTVEVKGDQENVVTFTQAAKTVDWLHDENT